MSLKSEVGSRMLDVGSWKFRKTITKNHHSGLGQSFLKSKVESPKLDVDNKTVNVRGMDTEAE